MSVPSDKWSELIIPSQILSRIVSDRLSATQDIASDPNLNFAALATQTEGYSASDLQDLVARAIHQVAMRISLDPSAHAELSHGDFIKAQTEFVPLTLRDVKLEKSNISWSDIGGEGCVSVSYTSY